LFLSSIKIDPLESQFIEGPTDAVGLSFGELAERAAALTLLSVASPVIAVSAAAVAILSGRSPFIAHLRVGRNGKSFWTLKLRTMWNQGERRGKPEWIEYIVAEPSDDAKDPADPRVVSRFAAFCRRHSIDELPQLWHVVRGEMSLVGPRPLTRSELTRHYGAHAAEILSVKPGITGLWQVNGRSAVRFPRRSVMDLELVRTLTPRMYLRILLRTLPAVILGSGSW
jgi:lipopolysaccharide/colanic/teichoic acid biosynthesis glycosyltransferase